MAFLISVVFLSSWTAVTFTFPRNTFDNILERSRIEFESSGSGPVGPLRGIVKFVQRDHHTLAQSGFFRRGLTPRRASSFSSRSPFPSFLSQGHPGPALTPKSPLHHPHPKSPTEIEFKKRQALHMWQRAIGKGDKMTMSLPVNLKDTKQTCTAVPFIQQVTADGCETVKVHNKLCFGQCSSLFVPSEAEFAGFGTPTGALHHWAPCSHCAPSKAHTVALPLRCVGEIRERRTMVVEECKCEIGREGRTTEVAALAHL